MLDTRYSRCLALLLVFALFGVGESIAAEDSAESEDASEPEKTCFRVRDTRSFSAIDDRFVYVKSIRDQHYLLTLDNRSYGLEYSIKIAIANEFDRVCSNDRAVLTYRDFNRLHRCEILDVEAVEDLDEAEELVAIRTTPRPKKKKENSPD